MNIRERRTVVFGLGIMGALVLGVRVMPWAVRSIRLLEAQVSAQGELLARARRELAGRGAVSDSVDLVRTAMMGVADAVLLGRSVRDAAADLMSRVTLAATHSNVRLRRVDHIADTADTGSGLLGKVTARALLETDVRGLAELLRQIEGDPGLFVIDAHIDAEGADETSDRPEVLRFEFTVGGWYLKADPDTAERIATDAGDGGGN